jgi:peptide-methionine (R)-S-oxide reductase
MDKKTKKSEEEWKQTLAPKVYQILRKKDTEPPFTGRYVHHKQSGVYACAGCGTPLFSSKAKFDSGSGWPSFYGPVDKNCVHNQQDMSHGMRRTEVLCSACQGHLGHVFDDGPAPTGKRYCINSGALEFIAGERKTLIKPKPLQFL